MQIRHIRETQPLAYVKKPNDFWTEDTRRDVLPKTAQQLGIAVSTVFRWLHKFLAALRERTDMTAVLYANCGISRTSTPIIPD